MATSAAVKEDEQPATRFAKDQLKSVIERIARLEEEKTTISDDIRDVYAEAKGNGFDVKALRNHRSHAQAGRQRARRAGDDSRDLYACARHAVSRKVGRFWPDGWSPKSCLNPIGSAEFCAGSGQRSMHDVRHISRPGLRSGWLDRHRTTERKKRQRLTAAAPRCATTRSAAPRSPSPRIPCS